MPGDARRVRRPAPEPPEERTAPALTADELRSVVHEAVAEALTDQRELIRTIVEEALQEIAWSDARREFEGPERRAGRPAGFRAVDGEA